MLCLQPGDQTAPMVNMITMGIAHLAWIWYAIDIFSSTILQTNSTTRSAHNVRPAIPPLCVCVKDCQKNTRARIPMYLVCVCVYEIVFDSIKHKHRSKEQTYENSIETIRIEFI